MLGLYSAAVITRDVSFEGFSAADWRRLADVFQAPAGSRKKREKAGSRGGVVAVTSGQRLRKLLHTKRGRLDLKRVEWPAPLDTLAREEEASWAVQITAGALEELAERFARRLRPEQEYIEQAFELLRAMRELESEGLLALWPQRFADVPLTSSAIIKRALDLLCSEDRSIALGVFDGGELYTALVARRRGLGFDRIVGPDELRPRMGLLSGDFRRDYGHLGAAIERELGPLALGCYGELCTFQNLAERDGPGALTLAIASRELVVSPANTALVLPVGIDLGRAAFHGLRGLAMRFGASSFLRSDGPLGPALDRAEEFVSRDLANLLGFNPWALLVKAFERDRSGEHD
ncbi:MAG TPA: hypothetical protein VGM29_14100 [Polyangiaceae bacterium]